MSNQPKIKTVLIEYSPSQDRVTVRGVWSDPDKAPRQFLHPDNMANAVQVFEDVDMGWHVGFKGLRHLNWIKVEDRLPEKGKKVQVFSPRYGQLTARYDVTTWDVGIGHDLVAYPNPNSSITHWAELLEDPEVEG